MRWVFLDTETTGLRADDGHRIIEIGCVEIINRQPTDRHLHVYLDPEREVDEGAAAVHGMTWDDLRGKPKFADVVDQFLEFVDGAEVIIHNAPFDVSFLDAELKRLGRPLFREHIGKVTDSLAFARELHPGKRNSLDALCDRYDIANAHRVLHGALLDCRLLADVYLAMTRGQESFEISLDSEGSSQDDDLALGPIELAVLYASDGELQAHQASLDGLDKEVKGACVWRSLSAAPPEGQPAA